MILRKELVAAMAVASICCFSFSVNLAAATAPLIKYKAAGTFASLQTSGNDTLKLAGEPFAVSISVSAATKPTKTGANWAEYAALKLTGTVHSGLLGTQPVNIVSPQASITQFVNPGLDDLFLMQAPVKVVGILLTIKASITMPSGTITKPLLHPFGAITLTTSNSSVTYSDGTNSTVLAIQSGTLIATVPAAAQTATALRFHSIGAEAVPVQGDGTTTVRSVGTLPVEPGFSTETVISKFENKCQQNTPERPSAGRCWARSTRPVPFCGSTSPPAWCC